MESYTSTFRITSSLGLHERPSRDLVNAIRPYIERGLVEEIEMSSKRYRLHYEVDGDPPVLCDFTEMALKMGDELDVSIVTKDHMRGIENEIYGKVQEALDKRYQRDENEPSKSVLLHHTP